MPSAPVEPRSQFLRVRFPAIEQVEPAGELLLLLQDAPLDALNLFLRARLLIELGADSERVFLGLQFARAGIRASASRTWASPSPDHGPRSRARA